MKSKKVLRICENDGKELIGQAPSQSLMMNDSLYSVHMGDTPKPLQIDIREFKNFPVDVRAMRVDWILETFQGKQFLKALHTCEDSDLFKMSALS